MGIELLTPYTKVELEPQKTGSRRQIGLFVGKFAPIHLAHLVIATRCGESSISSAFYSCLNMTMKMGRLSAF